MLVQELIDRLNYAIDNKYLKNSDLVAISCNEGAFFVESIALPRVKLNNNVRAVHPALIVFVNNE